MCLDVLWCDLMWRDVMWCCYTSPLTYLSTPFWILYSSFWCCDVTWRVVMWCDVCDVIYRLLSSSAVALPPSSPVLSPTLRPPLPPNWEERVDPSTGRAYFINHVTRTTSWERPQPWGVLWHGWHGWLGDMDGVHAWCVACYAWHYIMSIGQCMWRCLPQPMYLIVLHSDNLS